MSDLEAGPDLNDLVAEKVMQWHKVNVFEMRPGQWWQEWREAGDEGRGLGFGVGVTVFCPSTDIATAWGVAEKCRLSVIQFSPTDWLAGQIYSTESHGWTEFTDDNLAYGVIAETAPLAICRSALRAVEV